MICWKSTKNSNFKWFSVLRLKDGSYYEHPEVLSGQFDGDIVLNEEQAKIINNAAETNGSDNGPITYNGILHGRWTKNVIPIALEEGTFSPSQMSLMQEQFEKIQKVSQSCIKFVARTNETNYIGITVCK